MKKLKDFSIRQKLIISHGSIIVSTFLFIVALLFTMKNMQLTMTEIYEGPTKNISHSTELYYPQVDIQRAMNLAILEGPESYSRLENTVNADIQIMNNAFSALQNNLKDQDLKNELNAIYSKLKEVTPHREKVMNHIRLGEMEEAKQYQDLYYRPAVEETKKLIDQFEVSITESAKDYCDTASKTVSTILFTGVVVLIAITMFAVLITGKIRRMIETPIVQLKGIAEEISVGNLSAYTELTYESHDELGALSESMRFSMKTIEEYIIEISDLLSVMAKGDLTKDGNQITDFRGQFSSIKHSLFDILKSFNSTLKDINLAANQVDSGSNQVADGAQALSQGASEQAASTQQLAASIVEIDNQIRQAGEFAQTANEKTGQTGNLVLECNTQMTHMVSAMDDISQASQEIGKIIKTIEDIAFQTNILALNAAVEAARAGAAGKGFAVVADEVRNLAAKSAEASKDTAALIERSMASVDRGADIAHKTAQNLRTVVDASTEVRSMVDEISRTVQDQSAAIQEISIGIDQISSVVQMNSATSEESAAASEELSSQASMLKHLIGRFKLYGETPTTTAPVAQSDYADDMDFQFNGANKY